MRSMVMVLGLLSLVGCKRDGCDPDTEMCGVTDDTGDRDTEDTEDTGDTADTADTGEEWVAPTYAKDEDVTYKLTNPESWEPLSWEEEVWSDEVIGFDVALTVGANITGTTDVALTVESNLEHDTNAGWQQYFTGLKDGGKLDAEISINWPIEVSIDNTVIDLSPIIESQFDADALPQMDWTWDQFIFDTLSLEADSDIVEYTATTHAWHWEQLEIDPADWAPYIDLKLDASIDFKTTFSAKSYDIHDRTNDNLIFSHDQAADRADVSSYLPQGAEPNNVRFDTKAYGTLKNELDINLTGSIRLWTSWGLNSGWLDVISETIDIGTDNAIVLKFEETSAIHTQVE